MTASTLEGWAERLVGRARRGKVERWEDSGEKKIQCRRSGLSTASGEEEEEERRMYGFPVRSSHLPFAPVPTFVFCFLGLILLFVHRFYSTLRFYSGEKKIFDLSHTSSVAFNIFTDWFLLIKSFLNRMHDVLLV